MTEIDKNAQEELNKKQVELGISDEKEMRRTELNFYCEFYSTLVKLNEKLEEVNTLISEIGAERIGDYLKTLSNNVKKEEQRLILQKQIEKSHKKPKKGV